MTMHGIRRWLGGVAAVALLGVAAAACGGTASDSRPANASFVTGSSGAAAIAPASALAYFAVDSSLESRQWQQVGTLLSRFPDRTKLLSQLLHAWQSGTKTSFQADVRPALGDQVDGVAFKRASSHRPDFVLLVRPRDSRAFTRLVAKLNATDPASAAVVGDYRGWKVIGQTRSSITAFEAAAKAGPPLTDDATFKDATGNLADDPLAAVYANGAQLTSAVTSVLPQAVNAAGVKSKVQWVAADLVAATDGLRLDGVAKSGTSARAPHEATLLDDIPADALGVLSFHGNSFASNSAPLRTGATALGLQQRVVRAYEKLAASFANENALYVRRGTGPFPEVTLVTTPANPASVDETVVRMLKQISGGQVDVQQATIGSVNAHMVDLGRVSIYWGADQDRFVVTDDEKAFAELRGGGPKLSDDPTYKEAKSAAGMPDATDGFLYVNLTDSIQTIESFAQAAGTEISPEVRNNLRPLHTAIAWTTHDGSVSKATLFVGIN